MSIAEIVVIRRQDGVVQTHTTCHNAAPWFGRVLLAGPDAALSMLTALPEQDECVHATSVIVLDIPNKRALFDAPAAFLDPEEHEETHRAADAIIAGLWSCFGWEIRFRNRLEPEMPQEWPEAPRTPRIDSCHVRRLLRHLGDWSPVARHLPSRAQLGRLASLPVALDRGIPVVDPAGSVRDPRKIMMAAGIGVAAGFLRADDLALVRPSEPWVTGADPSRRAQLDWNRLNVDPRSFARSLAGVNGLSPDENLENIEATIEDELRNRDLLKVDVWHLLDACDPDTRVEIAERVQRMFEKTGMV